MPNLKKVSLILALFLFFFIPKDGHAQVILKSDFIQEVSESNESSTYLITLNDDPLTETVLIDLVASTASSQYAIENIDFTIEESSGTPNDNQIIFDTNNWNTGVEVILTSIEDNIADSTTSFNGQPIQPAIVELLPQNFVLYRDAIVLYIIDNDTASLTLSKSTVEVSESGTTDTYTAVLTSEPSTAEVVVDINTDNQTEVSPSTLTFTPANWNTPQTVTVSAIDDSEDEGEHESTITHTINDALSSPEYDSVEDSTVTVAIADDESSGGSKGSFAPGYSRTAGSGTTAFSTTNVNTATDEEETATDEEETTTETAEQTTEEQELNSLYADLLALFETLLTIEVALEAEDLPTETESRLVELYRQLLELYQELMGAFEGLQARMGA